MGKLSKIGITSYIVKNFEFKSNKPRGLPDQNMIMATEDYSRSIVEAGGVPFILPAINKADYAKNIAAELDGFIFAGGTDINPIRYCESPEAKLGKVVPERDEFEFTLLEEVLKLDKPVLAICRGIQLLNIYFGGTLYQDISGKLHVHAAKMFPKYEKTHKIIIKENSIIHSAYNTSELMTNSFHHQAVKDIGEDLIVTASSEDGVVEALEHSKYKFVVGVQWHPEMMSDVYPEQLKIFEKFIDRIQQCKYGYLGRVKNQTFQPGCEPFTD